MSVVGNGTNSGPGGTGDLPSLFFTDPSTFTDVIVAGIDQQPDVVFNGTTNSSHHMYDDNNLTSWGYTQTPPIEAKFSDPDNTYPWQQRTLQLIPHFTAFLSIIGSFWVITDVCRDKKKQQRVYHRLVLCLSMGDLVSSMALFLSAWPAPRGIEEFAGGNQGTCNAQGFILQLNIVTPFYNMFLSIYYLLVIRLNWSESRIRCKAEHWMHGTALVWALGTAVAGLPLKLYNPAVWCTIAPSPLDCTQSHQIRSTDSMTTTTDCIRGDNANIYMYAFFYIPLWISIAVAILALLLVYWYVYRREQRVAKYRYDEIQRRASSAAAPKGFAANENLHRSRRRRSSQAYLVAIQSAYYVGVFVLTWLFPSVSMISFTAGGRQDIFWINFLRSVFYPLQGFFNFCIYIRPRVQKYLYDSLPSAGSGSGKRVGCGMAWFRAFGRAARRSCNLCGTPDDDDYKLGTGCSMDDGDTADIVEKEDCGGEGREADPAPNIRKMDPYPRRLDDESCEAGVMEGGGTRKKVPPFQRSTLSTEPSIVSTRPSLGDVAIEP